MARTGISFVLVVALGCWGCRPDEADVPAAQEDTRVVKNVVARVGGRPIGASDVAARMAAEGLDSEAALSELIDEELLCQAETSGPPVEEWSSQDYRSPVVQVFSDLQDLIVLDPVHEVDDRAGWPSRSRSVDDA